MPSIYVTYTIDRTILERTIPEDIENLAKIRAVEPDLVIDTWNDSATRIYVTRVYFRKYDPEWQKNQVTFPDFIRNSTTDRGKQPWSLRSHMFCPSNPSFAFEVYEKQDLSRVAGEPKGLT